MQIVKPNTVIQANNDYFMENGEPNESERHLTKDKFYTTIEFDKKDLQFVSSLDDFKNSKSVLCVVDDCGDVHIYNETSFHPFSV